MCVVFLGNGNFWYQLMKLEAEFGFFRLWLFWSWGWSLDLSWISGCCQFVHPFWERFLRWNIVAKMRLRVQLLMHRLRHYKRDVIGLYKFLNRNFHFEPAAATITQLGIRTSTFIDIWRQGAWTNFGISQKIQVFCNMQYLDWNPNFNILKLPQKRFGKPTFLWISVIKWKIILFWVVFFFQEVGSENTSF